MKFSKKEASKSKLFTEQKSKYLEHTHCPISGIVRIIRGKETFTESERGCTMNFLNSYSFVAISFVLFTALVAFISWWKTRGDNLQSESGYYLAGHSLPAIVVAGSLVMTDLSAEQLVGNNGQSVRVGITTFATQGLSWLGLVIAAVVLLPVFLKHGMTTLPEFFEKRYDATVRRIVSIIMLLSFILIMLPTILYAGAQVFVNIFHVDELFGISTFAAIAIMCVLISVIGSIYAIFGGLKAIAVSDTLNGVGMLKIGRAHV